MKVYISSVPAIQIRQRRVWAVTVKEGEAAAALRRRRVLRRMDGELEKGNYKAALSLVKQLKAHPAGLRGFSSAAAKAPGSVSPLDELRLSGEIEVSSLQLAVDAILHTVRCSLGFQMQEEQTEMSLQDFRETMDVESYDSTYEDHRMCMQHEAGHFLVGYMLGALPRRYKVPSVEDLLQDKFAAGKVEFIGFEFLRDVGVDIKSNKNLPKRKLNRENLRKFSSVILGGLAAEYLLFGHSELLHSDVEKLYRVLQWLNLTENEANSEIKKAAEAAVLILSRHSEARSKLAEAMALGRSVGFCIETVEKNINLQ
ncbi:hypothetical protein ABFS83_12G124100 [Erythranthe nasuta]